MVEPLTDQDYEAWLEALAKECRCCPLCWSRPCEGCQQGSLCDRMPCHCDDYDEYLDADEDDRW